MEKISNWVQDKKSSLNLLQIFGAVEWVGANSSRDSA